jgi:hypothetical protein
LSLPHGVRDAPERRQNEEDVALLRVGHPAGVDFMNQFRTKSFRMKFLILDLKTNFNPKPAGKKLSHH